MRNIRYRIADFFEDNSRRAFNLVKYLGVTFGTVAFLDVVPVAANLLNTTIGYGINQSALHVKF